jgi:phage terminase small subunit
MRYSKHRVSLLFSSNFEKVGEYMPKVDGLTEKMKTFCREYVANKGNGTQAYLSAYDGSSETAASIESSKLLRRDDITEYIATLNKPMENRVLNERQKKRDVLWSIVEAEDSTYADKCRALDLLNKMDMEYITINKTIEEKSAPLDELDADTLRRLAGASTT